MQPPKIFFRTPPPAATRYVVSTYHVATMLNRNIPRPSSRRLEDQGDAYRIAWQGKFRQPMPMRIWQRPGPCGFVRIGRFARFGWNQAERSAALAHVLRSL